MALSTDPLDTFDMVLSRHEGREDPPTLYLRQITGRQRIELERAFDTMDGTASEAMQRCYDVIRQHVAGWNNYGVSFDPAALEDITTWEDICELRARWSFASISAADEKKSKLPAPADVSAAIAP